MRRIEKRGKDSPRKWRFNDDFISLNRGQSAYISPDITTLFLDAEFVGCFVSDNGDLILKPSDSPDDFKLSRPRIGGGSFLAASIFRREFGIVGNCRFRCRYVKDCVVVDMNDVDYGLVEDDHSPEWGGDICRSAE